VIDAVVKVGGSLGRGERLREVCAGLAEAGRRHRLLVVPGGGGAADVVREQDARFGLRPSTAHWMAVLAMDQYGLLLADLTPGAEAARTLDRACARLTEKNGVVILLPSEPLRHADALPHDWSVTSDAIAAWVTQEADARLLVLLKDHHGMARLVPAETRGTPHPMDGAEVAASGSVDGHLAGLLSEAAFDLWIIDGEHPRRLTRLLDDGSTEGVKLVRQAP
jgi:aspartokinase-like uncharacterized kinase